MKVVVREAAMQQTGASKAVWQRRTNKIVAAGITIIGLTMMLSLIPQCIYIGIVFVSCSLIWLGWMTVREKKAEPPRPEGQHPASPVLFLVASHHLSQSSRGPTLPDPEDKPPTYDQILKLDGLPPDYFSILSEKPPRYEDLSPALGWGACALPAELYPGELACVHQVPAIHTQSPSAFLQESPLSWAASTTTSPVYTATHNPAFARDNPSFQPLVEDHEAKEAQDKDADSSDGSSEPLSHRAA
ncbi:uncharacterized protein LOC127003768 isoform X2 [Eriocheir sinensis]|uniref:uncharacterized protein LOC127003768 isoform X2 n=1 Tax=Eriocheir sinensis TaxID=95602 RepID=UPI0021C75DFD|nr:uncharacterized protein LOC127003768 isoform X2 [Eriocheir sinensis]